MTGLTLRPFFWRPTHLFPETRLVSRTHDGIVESSYGEFGERVRSLLAALADRGVGHGDRIGTFGWNHHRHLEAYYAAPLSGAQLHTINVQLGDDDITYIVEDADDDVLFVDPGEPFETIERLWDELAVNEVVVMGEAVPDTDIDAVAYEDLIAEYDPLDEGDLPDLEEDYPAGMCYTSGTTGRPKGVEYTHKMIYAHAMMVMTLPASASRKATWSCPSCRCSTSTPGSSPTPRRWPARRRSIPVRHRARRTCSS